MLRLFFQSILLLFCSFLFISPSHADIRFEDVTAQAGLHYTGPTWGVAWGDFNADGYPDIFVSNHSTYFVFPSLYLNQGDGTFVDIADKLPLDGSRDLHGPSWADFDNDGDLDLFVLAGGNRGLGGSIPRQLTGMSNVLWVNTPDGFVEQADKFRLSDAAGRGRMPVWMDVDKDGRLDVILSKANPRDPGHVLYMNRGAFFEPCPEAFPGLSPRSQMHIVLPLRVSDQDRTNLMVQGSYGVVQMYEQTEQCQWRQSPLMEKRIAAGEYDVSSADFTGNLRPDLFVVRAAQPSYGIRLSPSQLAFSFVDNEKERSLSFASDGGIKLRITPANAAGWSSARIFLGRSAVHPDTRPFVLSPTNPDYFGQPDIAHMDKAIGIGFDEVSGQWSLVVRKDRLLTLYIGLKGSKPIAYEDANMPVFDSVLNSRSDLMLVQEEHRFVDKASSLGLSHLTSCISVTAGDFDNDMDLDLYLGCSTDTVNLPNRLYENLDGKMFVDVSSVSGASDQTEGMTGKVSTGDFDRDGFLDLFVTNGRGAKDFPVGPHQLFRNKGNGNHWLELDLEGTASNRDAYGARVFLRAGGRTQMRARTGGFHAGAQDDALVHFGLGQNEKIDELVVQWPNGKLESFAAPQIDQRVHLVEGTGAASPSLLMMVAERTSSPGMTNHFLAVLNGSVDPSSIVWDFGDGERLSGCLACQHNFVRAGAYVMTLTAEDEEGSRFKSVRRIEVK